MCPELEDEKEKKRLKRKEKNKAKVCEKNIFVVQKSIYFLFIKK